jgi:hypothetical protein
LAFGSLSLHEPLPDRYSAYQSNTNKISGNTGVDKDEASGNQQEAFPP